jgi:hypothetical protein
MNKSDYRWKILLNLILGLIHLTFVSPQSTNFKGESQPRITRPTFRPVSSKSSIATPQIKVRSIQNIGDNNETNLLFNEIQVLNSSVTLNKNLKRVELICNSSYPIKWEFLVKGISVSFLH